MPRKSTTAFLITSLFISNATAFKTTTIFHQHPQTTPPHVNAVMHHHHQPLQHPRPKAARRSTPCIRASPQDHTTVTATTAVTPIGSGLTPLDSTHTCKRRESIRRIAAGWSVIAVLPTPTNAWGSPTTAAPETTSSFSSSSLSLSSSEAADNTKKEFTRYASEKDKFSISIPTNFKTITKTAKPKRMNGKGTQLFSAIDLNSGTVVTVHRERACPASEYASRPDRCDVILPPDVDGSLLSERTLERDAGKILVRHDDRDNVVLGGSSTLRSVEMVMGGEGLFMVADTVLPTGGTYEDEMGIRRESMITRLVKARVVSQSEGGGGGGGGGDILSLLGIWVSAPLDEWQKPVMGTKLNQIMDSIRIEGGRLE